MLPKYVLVVIINRNMFKKLPLLFALIICSIGSIAQDISIGKRDSIFSETLNQNRGFSVYLPPSYNNTVNQKFPVLYILDGDYNFQYVAGILELHGGISELIPETILVAISGKGTATYRNNCKPNIEGIMDKGNADDVASFIEKELIPYVDSNYKTNNFKVLAGHSVGGIFVINTALHHPNLFNHYIAISPALWWGKNAINEVAEKLFAGNENFKSSIYISLANERGMGVDKFLKVIPNNVKKESFQYKQFPKENHNSVGAPTYNWALKDIYDDWRVGKEYFSSAEKLKNHYQTVNQTYGSVFNIPLTVLANTNYILRDKPEEITKVQTELKTLNPDAFVVFNTYRAGKLIGGDKLEEAEKLLKSAIMVNPNSFEIYHNLAKVHLAKNDHSQALSFINKSIKIAADQDARQWQVNELKETRAQINEASK